MRYLRIKNFGPLLDIDLELDQFNLIIGLQSSGKSCVMMTACHCAWVEKRISLRQSAKEFEKGSAFMDLMLSYYRAKGYLHADTYIAYSTDCMEFTYDNAKETEKFTFKWNRYRWRYKRPKVSYVPAERNMVSLVTNWNRLETQYDSILDFKSEWDIARRYVKSAKNILGTGISYMYDEATDTDSVISPAGVPIELVSSSSGIQSLVPQMLHLMYLEDGIYKMNGDVQEKSLSEKQLINNLLDLLYARHYNKKTNVGEPDENEVVHLSGRDYPFKNAKVAEQFQKEVANLTKTHHVEVFLEEPEINLFPPTQFQLMNYVVEMAQDRKRHNFFFVATHSPYVLSHLLQENLPNFRLFLTYPLGNGMYSVKTASEDDIQQIYDNGSDAFFNFDAFVGQ